MKTHAKSKWRRFLIILTISIAVLTSIMVLINPNRYKEHINQAVFKITGRNLIITGKMRWSIFPGFGLKVQEIALKNTSNFQGPFLKAQELTIYISLIELLHGRISINGLHINNPILYLARNQAGQINFADLLTLKPAHSLGAALPTPTTGAAASANHNSATTTISVDKNLSAKMQAKPLFSQILINELLIKNANILWQDALTGQNFLLTELNISSKELLAHLEQKLAQITITGKLKDQTNRYSHELNFTTQLNANLETNTVILDPLKIQLGPTDIISQITVQFKKNLLLFNPIVVEILDGKYYANCSIDLKTSTPTIHLNSTTNSFEIYNLFKAFTNLQNLQGKTNINAQIQTKGNNITQFKKGLCGNVELAIQQGSYKGVDVHALVKTLENSIKTIVTNINAKDLLNLPALLENFKNYDNAMHAEATTNFDVLRATAKFTDGICKEAKFMIEHVDYIIQGKGEINLNNNSINMQVQALYKKITNEHEQNIAEYILHTPLTINITGDLSKPTITPELRNYCKDAIIKLHKDVLKNMLKNTFKKLSKQ